jgi:arylsulfatase A-like enzyme
MDEAVGIVLDELEESGLFENTIIIFTSDNGGVASGDNYSTSNLPLRGGKGYQWEGGLRVPYFIKVPGLSAGTSEFPVTGADFYPTILDLLGFDMTPEQHRDGISIESILNGGEDPESRPLFWHYPHYGNQGGEPSSILRQDQWKLIHYWEDGRNELYQLNADIHENHNVVDQHQEVAQELEHQLMRYLSNMNARFPSPDPEFDTLQAQTRKHYLEQELWPKLEQQRLQFLSPGYQPDSTWWGSELQVK